MAAPTIPQRPARSQDLDIPSIPPRPRRSMERSISPNRDTYARSPLNDPTFLPGKLQVGLSSLSRSVSQEVPPRPPSVTLPSIGQEGNEYAHLELAEESDASSHVEQKKTIAGDLPLHAPKASLPSSAAKSRIQAVTRTDSDSAAALGIGKPSSERGGSNDHHGQSISRSASSQQHSRPSSIFKPDSADPDEQGIPEIGMQIPLYKMAGDVQAPTPAASLPPPSTGIGFFNKGDAPPQKHHFRTKSGRDVFNGPPGSYGLRGHGAINNRDPFEKAWYDKHPEVRAREAKGEYGPRIPVERKEYNLSSAELNKIIHEPAADTTENNLPSTPDERIGFLASEEIASRMSSPHPATAAKRRSLQHSESPLRFMKSSETGGASAENDAKDEEIEEVIHVDHPTFALPVEGNTPGAAIVMDEPEEVPILAADELALHPETRYMTPAIELDRERHANTYDITPTHSRPHSRSNSIHNIPPIIGRNPSDRDVANTPLDDVKEYEPLFPDDEDKKELKRRSSIKDEDREPRHQFRSKDVWEDAPDSHLHETEVETPQVPEFSVPEAEHEPKEIFENDEDEQARKEKFSAAEEPLDSTEPKSFFNKAVRSDMSRPNMRHRFPSQDVWEDAPESHMHTAEIEAEPKEVPLIPARPTRSREDASSPTEAKKAPVIPDRPKPQVPARPSRGSSEDAVPLARSTSKEKPPVPARPVGSKIAALRGALDLESRLQAGPKVVPKAEEKEAEEAPEEKAPLADARKGRARGPQRRKPGASPNAASEQVDVRPKVSFVSAVTIWHVDEDGVLSIGSKKTTSAAAPSTAEKVVQNDQQDIEVNKGTDIEPEKTVSTDAKDPESGTVVAKEAEEPLEAKGGFGEVEKTAPIASS